MFQRNNFLSASTFKLVHDVYGGPTLRSQLMDLILLVPQLCAGFSLSCMMAVKRAVRMYPRRILNGVNVLVDTSLQITLDREGHTVHFLDMFLRFVMGHEETAMPLLNCVCLVGVPEHL